MTPTCPLSLGRILAGLATLLVVVAAPAAATAHEGPGVLTVETGQPTDAGRHYVVRLTWENDGHPAARATTLTATAFGPDGAAQTPVPLTAVDDDGRFEATLALPEPGQWRVNFTSVTPTASVDVQADGAAPSTTTSDAPSTTASPSTTGSDAAADAGADDQAAGEEDDDGGSGGMAVLLVAVVLLAAIGTAAVLLVRRAAGGTSTGDGASSDGDGRPSATATAGDAGTSNVAEPASDAEAVDSSEPGEADEGAVGGTDRAASDADATSDIDGSRGQATST